MIKSDMYEEKLVLHR